MCAPFSSCGDRAKAWLEATKDALDQARIELADTFADIRSARRELTINIRLCYVNAQTLEQRYQCLRQIRGTLFANLIALEQKHGELRGKIAGLQALIGYLRTFIADLAKQETNCEKEKRKK